MSKKASVRKAPRSAPPAPAEDEQKRAADLFVRGVVTRGEAARKRDGVLPPGATHEIVEEKEDELPKIVRKRFSAY